MVQDPHQRRATVAGEEIVLIGSEVLLIPLTRSHCSPLERVAGEFGQKKSEYPFSFVPLTAAEVRSYVDAALHQREAGERYPFVVQWNRTIVGSTSYAALDFLDLAGRHRADAAPGTGCRRNRSHVDCFECIGARFEGVRRVDMVGRDGAPRDSAYYSIVASEWPKVKSRLEHMLAKHGR